jgi:hypothetical protein
VTWVAILVFLAVVTWIAVQSARVSLEEREAMERLMQAEQARLDGMR